MMSNVYDKWERLVGAVIRREQLWKMFHDQSPSTSPASSSSDISIDSSLHDLPNDFSSPRGSSPCHPQALHGDEISQIKEESVVKMFPNLVRFDGFDPALHIEDILESSAEVLGNGTFGSVYSAVIDSGVTIVVRRLNRALNIPVEKFRQHMDIIGNIRHENVSPLRAYSSYKNEKLLMYDHHRNSSVSAMLHGKPRENRAHLDWDTRVRIAVGAARGLAYIHTLSGGKLVHGNIKSSNIFLNSEQYGCVGDLGLANMIAFPLMRRERYHGPEVQNTKHLSQASDVYSFGILLLELLTRKSPINSTGGNEVCELVKLVNSINHKDQTAKVFDVELLRDPNIKEQMVEMLEIGMSCVAKTPKKRPKMSEVVKRMEDMRIMRTSKLLLHELVFAEGFNPDFDFQDLLKASAEILSFGTFTTSYKATLDNGFTVVVKRLHEVNVKSRAFQQQIDSIRRMNHENVASLVAYYCTKDELLMVYQYYDSGSVSTMLHAKKDQNEIFIRWETRLRIAIGAARGIAHIHTHIGLHGNVKASNIFLNAQQHVCVSYGGLITLMRLTAGYFAPEVVDAKKFSQASDVYSFGVVLLELITGKVPRWIPDDGEVNQLVSWVALLLRIDRSSAVFDAELQGDPNIKEEMLRCLQVAMSCVESVPENRPKIFEVVKMLEDISGTKMIL